MEPMAAKATARSDRGYQWLRLGMAFLLLTAAALKGYDLATEPVLGGGLFNSRWVLIGVVEMELFFGLWLLAGVCEVPLGSGLDLLYPIHLRHALQGPPRLRLR